MPNIPNGPSLETYIETRLNLITEAAHAHTLVIRENLAAAVKTLEATLAERDIRYQQRFEAQEKAFRTTVETAEKAVMAALAAQERAVNKAEAASEKRFEGVNEFRNTLADQQRTLMPRSEVEVIIKAQNEKLNGLSTMIAAKAAESAGVKGGWGYAVGVVGFILTVLTLGVLLMKAWRP